MMVRFRVQVRRVWQVLSLAQRGLVPQHSVQRHSVRQRWVQLSRSWRQLVWWLPCGIQWVHPQEVTALSLHMH